MTTAQVRHAKECAALHRQLNGAAETLIARVESDLPPHAREAFEVWRHGFRVACANPDNEPARVYAVEAMVEMIALAKAHRPAAPEVARNAETL